MISTPDIVTKIKIESTTFEIYAYRKLTESECVYAIRQYLKQKHLNSVPKNQKIKIMTIIGSIQ